MLPGIPDTHQNPPESDSDTGSYQYTSLHDYQTLNNHSLLALQELD